MSDRMPGSSDPTINGAIHALAHGGDPDAVLASLLEAARSAAGAERAAALLWDGPAKALRIAGSLGLGEGDAEGYATAAGDRGSAIATAAHDRLAVTDGADPVHPDAVLWAWPIVLWADGVDEPIGTLLVSRSRPARIDPADADRLAAIADLIALLVDRARLVANAEERGDWMERVANSDGLTGLANARTLARVVELEVARASRQQTELCLAIFDVDGLSKVNQRAGMAVGDAVLREVAAVIAESVRLVDTVARLGPDEFVLVAPGAKGPSVIRRIVGAVAARPPIGDVSFTVSAGVARFPTDGTTEAELLAAAKAALREARRVGPSTVAEAPGVPTS